MNEHFYEVKWKCIKYIDNFLLSYYFLIMKHENGWAPVLKTIEIMVQMYYFHTSEIHIQSRSIKHIFYFEKEYI